MRDVHALNLSWLVRLRWGATVGQLAVILGVHFGLGLEQRLAPLLGMIAVVGASNAALGVWVRHERPVSEALVWVVMALDVGVLTVLLGLSGGAFNPFSALYLVHIALDVGAHGAGHRVLRRAVRGSARVGCGQLGPVP